MFAKRIELLREDLSKKNLDGILVSAVPNIFYLSGITFFEPTEREGYILITKNSSYLITSSLYKEAVLKQLNGFELLETTLQKSLEQNLIEVAKKQKLGKIGFEEDNLTVSEYLNFKKIFSLKPTSQIVQNLRQIKDQEEIEKINMACEVTDKAFDYILGEIKLGVSEIEIANKIKRYFENQGLPHSFSPVVAFGANSSMPHHISSETKLNKNQIVLMDFGVKYEGYCSDFTRTVFFGKADGKFKKIYQAVLEAQALAFEYLKNEKNPDLKEADKVARLHIVKEGFQTIPHSLGHGIGIEVHDGLRLSPTSKEKAKNNTVFSLEPGIYIPGFGGVRIEDLVVYKNGPKFITHSKRDLIEI